MRIAVGQLWQETNTFNPLPTTRDDFEQFGVLRGPEVVARMADTNELGGFIQSLRRWPQRPEIVGLVRLPAWPSGRATAETFRWLRGELLDALEQVLPVDGVLLALHGALAADEYPDVEGGILADVRALVGPGVPIVVTLDLHAHVTPLMAEAADALVLYHTAPHVDVLQTGMRGAEVLRRILVEGARPVTALAAVPCVLPAERANTEAACGVSVDLKRWLQALESRPEVLSAGLATVQPWLDVPHLGSAVVITTDQAPSLAEELCAELAGELWRRREEYLPDLLSVEEAVARAHATHDGLVVLSDAADATTSGSPGDSVWILQELLKHDWRGPVLVTVVAPDIVQAAKRVGIGERWTGEIGGVRDNRFGIQISLSAEVEGLFDARFVVNGHLGNLAIDMGRAAVLRTGEVRVIVTSRSGPHLRQSCFKRQAVILLPLRCWWRRAPPASGPLTRRRAAAIYCVRAPGCAPSDFWNYPYQQIDRPLWPWDDMPAWTPRPRLFASRCAEAVSSSLIGRG